MTTHVPAPALTGVVPPLLTPLTAEGDLDTASLRRLVEHLVQGGVDGIFALGSSGEVAFHDDAMRRRVLAEVVDAVGGRLPVIAGCIDMQTERVIAHVRAAEEVGVDGVVVTAPFYAITGPAEIEAHLRAIGEAASTPVWAYDIPVCVHTKLPAEMLVRLGSEGVLAGVKDSSGDDVSFRRLVAANRGAGSPLSILTGHEIVVDGAMLAGADGAVPGLANVDPTGYVRLDRAARAGDWATVRTEQDRLATLFEIVFVPRGRTGPAAGIGAFKTALQELGILDTNAMARPLASLDDREADGIRALLAEVGLAEVSRA